MTARARVDAMKPSAPPKTRTADPSPPDNFWTRGNYLGYVAFGATGILMTLVALGVLGAVWALGNGESAWNAVMASYRHPLYLVWHIFALVGVTWFAFRFFGVFPKTQPPRIGPFPRPSEAFFKLALNGAFLVASLAVAFVLGGVLP